MHVAARGKINLRLRVLARDAGGFHQIETIFCRVALADELVVTPTTHPGIRLEVTGADVGPTESNLVTRAVLAYCEAAGVQPAFAIALRKRIPTGAGLGGGSSDAAATLRALDALHAEPLGTAQLLELSSRLGSDVPFFITDTPVAVAWGRGQRLLTHDGPGPAPALIVMPPTQIVTADAYARLALEPAFAAPPAILEHDALGSWKSLAAHAGNDFERLVLPSIAALHTALECLRAAGAIIAQLTGSGAAVFGVFASDEACDTAARTLVQKDLRMQIFTTTAGV